MTLPSDQDSSGRTLGAEEVEALSRAIATGTLTSTKGKFVRTLETEFAKWLGVKHAYACASGTAAVHLAVAALDPEPGDEIITTSITDMGAISPILYQQAIPVFADVDPVTLNVTPKTVAARITGRTRAIIATHLFGGPCDVIGIRTIADACGIPVIEDCAQAYLATQAGRLVGTVGAIGAFSLQQGKHMTTGEGGITITCDPAYARRMTLFSDKAWGYGDPQPDHYFLALNYRMTDLQGAVARAQLGKLDGVVARRQASAEALTAQLADLPGLVLPRPIPGTTHVYWKYPLIVDPEVVEGGADALGGALKAQGVFCAPRYIQKPAFMCQVFMERKTFGRSQYPWASRVRDGGSDVTYDPADHPGTMRALERVVVLPWNEFYTDEHVAFIAGAVRAAVTSLSRKRAVA